MNNVEQFFDKLASNWDEGECHTLEEKKSLLDLVGLKENDYVIDIACGTGVITSLIHEYTNSNVLGVDISQNMIDIAKNKYQDEKWASFIKADILESTEVEKFDAAILYNCFPHFMDVKALSIALSKMLKPNGRFAILHSLSRTELDKHHAARAQHVSRSLAEPIVEAKAFTEEFNIILATESDHSFVIVGEKR